MPSFARLARPAAGALVGVALAGAALAQTDLLAERPLIAATLSNNASAAEEVLGLGGNPDVRDGQRRTALILAAVHGYEEVAAVLLRYRAGVRHADRFGNTAMFYAASGNHAGILARLLEAGAKVDRRNRQGVTPLMIAAAEGSTAALKVLLAAGADSQATDFTGRTALDQARQNRRREAIRLLSAASGRPDG